MAASRRAENWDSESESQNDNIENSEVEDDGSHGSSRKRPRHSLNQIETMETFFRDCPHPNENERRSLSQALGLDPLQVKFWFQNKRTQLKAQQKRRDNIFLQTQNDKLRAENKHLIEAVNNVSCLKCHMPCRPGGISSPLDELKLENARLKMELESLYQEAKEIVDKSIWNDARFTTPLVSSRALDLELGGRNSGEGLIFAANMQFNVSHLTHLDDLMKRKKPRLF